MKIGVVGSGGREFALAEKLRTEVATYAVPGSHGIERSLSMPSFRLPENMKLNSPEGFAYVSNIGNRLGNRKRLLFVIGPEDPLAGGMSDYLQREGYFVFGPTQAASVAEASKCWSAEFTRRNGIPAPTFYNPESYQDALDYVRRKGLSLVVKGDGLAGGKGVTIVETFEEAKADLYAKMVEGKLGGPRVNIQDKIDIAYELSAMAIVDVRKRNGRIAADYRLLLYSMDHKPIGDNDKGPNTGGMGAVAPVPLTEEMKRRIVSTIIEPTIEGFEKEGIEFTGCLYPALAIDKDGNIWWLEYNVRFPDPEIQVVLDLMDSPLHDYLMAATVGELHRMPAIRWREGYSVIVNLTSRGYPEPPKTSYVINGLDDKGRLINPVEGVTIVHAGTRYEKDKWLTDGGRVVGVRSRARDLQSAINRAYSGVEEIYFDGVHFRRDIARKALALAFK